MGEIAHSVPPGASTRYAVITADVVDSRSIAKFEEQRDILLREISSRHRREKRVLSPYTVTAWDEFQVILRGPEEIPKVLFDLRRLFAPTQLWIAVGYGQVSNVDRRPINQYVGGEAFERARAASDELKAANAKYPKLTQFDTGIPLFDEIANSVYHLQDTLIEGISEKQWQAINAQTRASFLAEAAADLQVDVSTLSRTLRRGHYWQLDETVRAMGMIIRQIVPKG